jgi:hypothetical protein
MRGPIFVKAIYELCSKSTSSNKTNFFPHGGICFLFSRLMYELGKRTIKTKISPRFHIDQVHDMDKFVLYVHCSMFSQIR